MGLGFRALGLGFRGLGLMGYSYSYQAIINVGLQYQVLLLLTRCLVECSPQNS